MPSFSDSIFLFILALLLFGPKRLPMLARELGKWLGEFRRASNEFKMQMEEELRLSEQADRQKQIAAMEAAAPVAPPIAEPTHPHLDATEAPPAPSIETELSPRADGVLPIATSGELSIMPPSTGLPTPRSSSNPLGGLIESIPEVERSANGHQPTNDSTPETAAHGS
jgi:sec-independent protein translocase protein TatB